MSSSVTGRPVLASAGACASACNVPKVTATVSSPFMTFITYLFVVPLYSTRSQATALTALPNRFSCKNQYYRIDEVIHRLSHFPRLHPTSEIDRRSDENRSQKSSLTRTRSDCCRLGRPGHQLQY